MFRSNKVNMVIAVVVAVLLWVYVVGQVNPNTTKKVSDIPITFVGEKQLNSNGLAVAKIEETHISVTLEGKRGDVVNINPEDVTVTADLTNLGKGKNAVPVVVGVPANTQLTKQSLETINVTVEDRVVETKEVKVTFDEAFEKGREPGKIRISPESMEVSGARSMINKVDYIQAAVGAHEEKEGKIEADIKAVPVDSSGETVIHVELSQKRVHVSAVMMEKKTVSLEVETVGKVAEGFQLDGLEIASQITIKGPEDVLANIDRVTAEPLDITGLAAPAQMPLNIILPEGTELAEGSSGLFAVVSVKGAGLSTIPFQANEAEVRNLKEGWKAEIHDTKITATVMQKDGEETGITLKDIAPYIDVRGLELGAHKVKIISTIPKGAESVVFHPKEIEVTISEV